MAQAAEPVIPLLLDERGSRSKTKATPVASGCPVRPVPPGVPPASPLAPTAPSCTQPRTVALKLPRRRGKVVSARVTALGKRAKVRRGVAAVRLEKARPGARVRVRIVQRVRRGKRTRTYRTTRTLKICAS
jgi:hypothetical protein